MFVLTILKVRLNPHSILKMSQSDPVVSELFIGRSVILKYVSSESDCIGLLKGMSHSGDCHVL